MSTKNIKIISGSYAGKVDNTVLEWIEKHKHKLDESFLIFIEKHHGTIPVNGEFKSKNGNSFKIARFLTLLNEASELTPPINQSYLTDRDIRIDQSIYTLIDEESATHRGFIDGEKLIPFASLCYNNHHPDEMDLSKAYVDLLCFFYSSNNERPKIVVWNGQKAIEEHMRIEELLEVEDLTEEEYYKSINYSSFIEIISENFDIFLDKLN